MLGHQLAIATRKYEQIYLDLKPKLSLTQLIVLSALGRGVARKNLAKETGLDHVLLNMILHRIKKRKYVERMGTTKLKPTVLTYAGSEALGQALRLADTATRSFLEMLGPSNRQAFSETLATIATSSLFQIPSRRV